MSDEMEFDALVSQLRSNSGAMGKMTAALETSTIKLGASDKSRAAAKEKLESDLNAAARKVKNFTHDAAAATGGVTASMSILGGNTDKAAEKLRDFANAVPGGALLGSLVSWGKNTLDSWKELSGVGQQFNGSMFGLAQAAAEAGMPLADFAKTVKDNSKVAAVYGAKNMANMMAEVRKRTEANGMYGFTMEGLNKVTGEYLENQRLYGNKSAATNSRTIDSTKKFAAQITAVAGTTGMAREDILTAVNGAMRDVAFTSAMIGRSSDDVQAFSDATMESVAILAGLPDIAGQTFSKFLSQSVGFGTAIFADAATTFIDGGLGQMVSSTDALARSISNGGGDIEGATWGYIEDFKSQVEANREGLRIQAMAGNASSKQILQMYSEVQNLTREEYERKKLEAEDTKSLTAFLSSVGQIFKRLLTSLMTGVFGKLEDIEGKMANLFREGGPMEGLEIRFEEWGKSIATWMSKIDEKQIADFAQGIENTVKGLLGLAGMLVSFGHGITKIISFFSQMGSVGTTVAVLGAITGLSLIPTLLKKGIGALFGMMGFRNDMVITARNVHVNGGMGMGGGGGGGRGSRGRRGGRSGRGANGRRFGDEYGHGTTQERWAERQRLRPGGRRPAGRLSALQRVAGGGLGARAMRGAATRVGGRGIARIAGRGIGKSLLKKIPGVGLGVGAGLGLMRLLQGDVVGAGLELASGGASMIPGLGTAASFGIDAALMGRDMGAMGGGRVNARTQQRPRIGRGGMLAAGALGAGVAGLGTAWAMGAFRNNTARPNTDATMTAIERAADAQTRTAQTDPRIAILEKQATEMKAIQEAMLVTHRESLQTLNRILTASRDMANNT